MLLLPRAPPPRLQSRAPACGCERPPQEAGGGGRRPTQVSLAPCWEKGSAILEPEPKVPCSRGARRVEVAAPAWIWEESAAPGPARLGSE